MAIVLETCGTDLKNTDTPYSKQFGRCAVGPSGQERVADRRGRDGRGNGLRRIMLAGASVLALSVVIPALLNQAEAASCSASLSATVPTSTVGGATVTLSSGDSMTISWAAGDCQEFRVGACG